MFFMMFFFADPGPASHPGARGQLRQGCIQDLSMGGGRREARHGGSSLTGRRVSLKRSLHEKMWKIGKQKYHLCPRSVPNVH